MGMRRLHCTADCREHIHLKFCLHDNSHHLQQAESRACPCSVTSKLLASHAPLEAHQAMCAAREPHQMHPPPVACDIKEEVRRQAHPLSGRQRQTARCSCCRSPGDCESLRPSIQPSASHVMAASAALTPSGTSCRGSPKP